MQTTGTQIFTERPSRIPYEARLQALCFWCETPHPARHALSVCPHCAATGARTASFPMGSLEMRGSYLLTDEAIDACMSRKAPGNYALGYLDGDTFMVSYVGRSDSDVRLRLHEWVGVPGYSPDPPQGEAAWSVQRRGPLSMVVAMQDAGDELEGGYTHFAYSYASSADAAFAKEWRNYDDFGGSDGLDNSSPPSRARIDPGART